MTEAVLPPPATVAIRPFVAGNWKMNWAKQGLEEALAIRDALAVNVVAADVMICPPATLLPAPYFIDYVVSSSPEERSACGDRAILSPPRCVP